VAHTFHQKKTELKIKQPNKQIKKKKDLHIALYKATLTNTSGADTNHITVSFVYCYDWK